MSEPWLKRNNPPYWNCDTSITSCWKTASSFLHTLSVRHHCFWRICFVCRSHLTQPTSSLRWPTRDTQETKTMRCKQKRKPLQTKRQKPQREKETLLNAGVRCNIWYMELHPRPNSIFSFQVRVRILSLCSRFYIAVLQCDFVAARCEIWIPTLKTITFHLVCLRFPIRVSQCDIKV